VSHFLTITLQHHNSPADFVRELFKPSKDAARHLVYNKQYLSFGFIGDNIKGVGSSLYSQAF